MAHIEKQRGKYRARFSDPLGKIESRTFARKADAERFLRQIDSDRVRGQWTQETYRRDLDKYVLPRFGVYRLSQLPADDLENWLNDEIAAGIAPSSAHRPYRTLRRMLQVAVQKQRILTNPCERVHMCLVQVALSARSGAPAQVRIRAQNRGYTGDRRSCARSAVLGASLQRSVKSGTASDSDVSWGWPTRPRRNCVDNACIAAVMSPIGVAGRRERGGGSRSVPRSPSRSSRRR